MVSSVLFPNLPYLVTILNKTSNSVKITRKKLHFLNPRTFVYSLDKVEQIAIESSEEISKYRKYKPNYKINIEFEDGITFPLTSSLYVKKEPLLAVAKQMREFLGLKTEVLDEEEEATKEKEDKKNH